MKKGRAATLTHDYKRHGWAASRACDDAAFIPTFGARTEASVALRTIGRGRRRLGVGSRAASAATWAALSGQISATPRLDRRSAARREPGRKSSRRAPVMCVLGLGLNRGECGHDRD